MSNWTHIVAVIDIDTGIEDKNIKGVVENKLQEAPKITGSEGDADIFVNVLNGYNTWTNSDCKSCKYRDSIQYHDNCRFTCGADENFQCPEGRYQTRIAITIIGDLRDRILEQTKQEYDKFYRFIENMCDYWVRNKTVNITE